MKQKKNIPKIPPENRDQYDKWYFSINCLHSSAFGVDELNIDSLDIELTEERYPYNQDGYYYYPDNLLKKQKLFRELLNKGKCIDPHDYASTQFHYPIFK